MARNDSGTEPSLLPFLQPKAPGIRLSFLPSQLSGSAEVFADIENPGPFAFILPARVVIDGNAPLADLFCLIQPDLYPATIATELRPISNPDVDEYWQQAFLQLRDTQDMPPGWPCQIDEGRLLPFRPLFYCRHVNAFCHPLCPSCGRPLQLCRDDRMLHEAGLAGYGDSLQRYLFCPACRSSSPQAFFYSKIVQPEAPPCLRGCADLLQDFSRLLAKPELADELPCVGCGHATDCYGPGTLVLERMQAIQFYPFYMLALPASTLNALDFISLLGGAGPDEIERHLARRQRFGRLDRFRRFRPLLDGSSGLLFAGEARHFLEVLYLKLTFLRKLLAMVVQQPAGPVNRMTLEGFWVDLPGNASHLPYAWNFSLRLIDPMGQAEPLAGGTSRPDTRLCGFLTRAWYYVLLVNAGQSMETVQDGLRAVIESGIADNASGIFEMRHLFWQPPDFVVSPDWQGLWLEALDLGMSLPCAGVDEDASQPLDLLAGRLDDLRARVRQALFQTPAAAPAAEPATAQAADRDSNDPRIAAMLTAILEQWPQPQAQTQPLSLEQTRVIPSPSLRPDKDGDYEETVILSAPAPGVADLEKTVLIPPSAPAFDTDDPAATVVLSPDGETALPGEANSGAPSGATDSDKPAADEDLEETVIVPPQRADKRKPIS